MRYTLVRECYSREFEITVNSLLNAGWELYGNPYVDGIKWYCQALIKKG